MDCTRITILASLASAALSACYGAAPPKLQPVAVPHAENAPLLVHSEERSHVETTHNNDSLCVGAGVPLLGASACLDAEYDIDQTVTEVNSTAQLGDIPLSYEQFLVLSDPHYDARVALLDEHTKACRASAVPEWIGIGLAVGGLVALSASDGENPMQALGWIGLGAGVTTYTAGYVAFGGDRCAEGRDLYRQLDHSQHAATMAVSGANAAREMQAVADQFNLRLRQAEVSRVEE